MLPRPTPTRRDFLSQALTTLSAAGAASLLGARSLRAQDTKPLKVAALANIFFLRSHAHVILENFLVPYLFNGKVTQPGMQVASLFVDQVGANDMSQSVARQFNIPVFPSIREALTLGQDQLAVDAVLLIGE